MARSARRRSHATDPAESRSRMTMPGSHASIPESGIDPGQPIGLKQTASGWSGAAKRSRSVIADAAGLVRLMVCAPQELSWGRPKPKRRACTCFGHLGLPVARFGGSDKGLHQTPCRCRHFFYRTLKRHLVDLGGYGQATEFPDELQRSVTDFNLGRGWIEIEQCLDVPAHGDPLGRWEPAHGAQAPFIGPTRPPVRCRWDRRNEICGHPGT